MSIPPQYSGGPRQEPRWEPETILWAGWQRKWLIVLGLLVGVAASAAVGSHLPRVYQSTAQISIVKKRPDAVTGVDTRQMAAEEYLAPPQDLLKSSLIIDGAIRAKGLDTLPIFAEEEKELTEQIRTALTVTPGKGPAGQSFMFKLSYRGADAADCRTVLAAILDSYKDFIDKKHQTISADTLELILREKQTLQKNLEVKEAAYREFREQAPLLGKGKDGLELRQERLNSIQAKRSALLLQRIELEGQLAALDVALKEGRSQEAIIAMLIEFVRKSDTPEPWRERQVSLQDQLFPLLQEERKLLQVHGAKHPEVLAIRNRIEVTRRLLLLPPTAWKGESGANENGAAKTIEDPIGLHTQILKQKLSHTKIAEEMLAKVFQTEQDEARRLAAFEIQNDSFRTSINLNQQLYEALVKRLNEASLIKNVGGYQIELIEPPTLGKKVAPSMGITLAVGAFLGLAAGFVLAFWASSRAARSRSRSEGIVVREAVSVG